MQQHNIMRVKLIELLFLRELRMILDCLICSLKAGCHRCPDVCLRHSLDHSSLGLTPIEAIQNDMPATPYCCIAEATTHCLWPTPWTLPLHHGLHHVASEACSLIRRKNVRIDLLYAVVTIAAEADDGCRPPEPSVV